MIIIVPKIILSNNWKKVPLEELDTRILSSLFAFSNIKHILILAVSDGVRVNVLHNKLIPESVGIMHLEDFTELSNEIIMATKSYKITDP